MYRLFLALVAFHFLEHVVQLMQLYCFGIPLMQAKGILGVVWPAAAHGEVLHFTYATVMLYGLAMITMGKQYADSSPWWMFATGFQALHWLEHALLLFQYVHGVTLCGAPVPIDWVQLIAGSWFSDGPKGPEFAGLLHRQPFATCNCPGSPPGTIHPWDWRTLVIRRPELHMIYNLIVAVPMVVAMYTDWRETRGWRHSKTR